MKVLTMKDVKARRKRADLVAIGLPRVDSGEAYLRLVGSDRELYIVAAPTVSDGVKPGKLVALELMVDGTWLRDLVSAARAAGWAE